MPEFLMPKLGADMTAGRLRAWRKQPGDMVHRGDIIAEVETDKADVEVEVFTDGMIERFLVEPGEKVPVGTVLATLRAVGAAEPAPSAPVPAAEVAPGSERLRISPAARLRARELGVEVSGITGTGPEGRITLKDVERAATAPAPPQEEAPHLRVSPAAWKHAEALGIDVSHVTGTGPGGRVTVEDVEHAAAHRTAPSPAPEESSEKLERKQRAARMRQAIAAAMSRSKREIPHYYLSTTIDMKPAMTWLAAENLRRPVQDRLLYGVLLVKAVALALHEVPELNGFWIEGSAVPGTGIHVGMAISLRGGGLVAPALHDADSQTLDGLMANLRDLTQRARAGILRSSEMSDPTITLTSLGEQGVEAVFGIIYPPQVALVGFGKIVERPWAVDGHLAAHPVLVATLAADHRVSDGHRGGRFLAAVDRLLQEPEKL